MKLFYLIEIKEFETKFCFLYVSNRILCFFFSIIGIFFVTVSFLQHVYSWIYYNHIFYCRSNIEANATLETKFLAYDIVIFDFGLMHRILGTTECVANYLDGGYMRAGYCLEHAGALIILLIFLINPELPLWVLWPALFMQSCYVLGMAILTMATAPKLFEALRGFSDSQLNLAFLIFGFGFCINWLFAFILWHYYWGIEKTKELEKKLNQNEMENKKLLDTKNFICSNDIF